MGLGGRAGVILNDTFPRAVSGGAPRSVALKLGCTADSRGLFENAQPPLSLCQLVGLISVGLVLGEGFIKALASRHY